MTARLTAICANGVKISRVARRCLIALAAVMLLWGCLEKTNPPGGDTIPRLEAGTGDAGLDSGTGNIVLVQGSFSTGGSGSAGNIVLVESGFELGETQCVGQICLTGGIVP